MRHSTVLLLLAAFSSCPAAIAQAFNQEPSQRPPVQQQRMNVAPASAASANAPNNQPLLRGVTNSTGRADAPAPATQVTALPPVAAATTSDVFGAQLFTGAFAREGATLFNPDYVIATGDTLQVRMWGAFEYDATLTVDPQGNVFLPNVGPVTVRGVRNADLQKAVEAAVRRVYRANVFSYASLAEAQPVRVFVAGFVTRPGQYSGTSMDSLLHYLDQAGGIDLDRGTFLAVQVQRGGQTRATVNLYEFLLQGRMPTIQLGSGDVIFVPPRGNTVKVNGLAANAKRFEFTGAAQPVAYFMDMAKPQASATHVRIVRNTGVVRNTEYYPLNAAAQTTVANGDELEFTADKKPGTISVRVEGEHQSPQEYVLPYGARLGELLKRIELNERSEAQNVQLFRQSVKQRQREMLAASLRSLETALLTARSGSSEEAKLRTEEANLTLQWVERARNIEPLGQVLISQYANRDDLLLENGDVLRIPTRDGLVLVSGEVLFPNAVAHDSRLTLKDYIQRAGGFTQNADNSRIVLARRDGSYEQSAASAADQSTTVNPGDQVLVLPKVDEKNRQFAIDITKILSQLAITAGVVFGL
jgi:protein involved in polysaccharide export with SLBB domain